MIVGHKSYPNAFTIVTPLSGIYYTGDTIQLSLKFPVTIHVDTTIGDPSLTLDFGGTQVWANYVSGEGTEYLNFEYVVTASDTDLNGIDILSMSMNGAAITYTGGGMVNSCNTTISISHFSAITVNAP